MPRLELGIIFNFHHAHNLIDNFHETAKLIRPYLWAVNLNGMKKDGPKILPIGKGDKETEMIKALNDYEYDGPFGILGHVENADVKEILETNLEGVRSIETLP